MTSISRRIVEHVLLDLEDRVGFDHVLDEMDRLDHVMLTDELMELIDEIILDHLGFQG